MKIFWTAAWSCAAIMFAAYAGYFLRGAAPGGSPAVFYSLDARRNDREIVRLIDGADRYAYFGVYTFTLPDIAEALVRAKRRGVEVRGITDRDQSQIKEEVVVLETLREARISLETQKRADGIMHLKLLVTDKAYAVGSYNWTWAATNVNDEVLEIGTDEKTRAQYLAIIRKILDANR